MENEQRQALIDSLLQGQRFHGNVMEFIAKKAAKDLRNDDEKEALEVDGPKDVSF